MIEALFMNNSTPAAPPREVGRKAAGVPSFRQEERVLDPKKAQNIAILLRALNVTREEVSDALLDGEYLVQFTAFDIALLIQRTTIESSLHFCW